MKTQLEQIIEIIRERSGIASVESSTHLRTQLDMDSLDVVELAMELEETFGIAMDLELNLDDMTVAELDELVTKLRQSDPAKPAESQAINRVTALAESVEGLASARNLSKEEISSMLKIVQQVTVALTGTDTPAVFIALVRPSQVDGVSLEQEDPNQFLRITYSNLRELCPDPSSLLHNVMVAGLYQSTPASNVQTE